MLNPQQNRLPMNLLGNLLSQTSTITSGSQLSRRSLNALPPHFRVRIQILWPLPNAKLSHRDCHTVQIKVEGLDLKCAIRNLETCHVDGTCQQLVECDGGRVCFQVDNHALTICAPNPTFCELAEGLHTVTVAVYDKIHHPVGQTESVTFTIVKDDGVSLQNAKLLERSEPPHVRLYFSVLNHPLSIIVSIY
jgi:hypothetical protein